MKKLILAAVAAFSVVAVFAEGTPSKQAQEFAKLPKEERQKIMYQRTGGLISNRDSLKGKVAIVNTQDRVAASNIQEVAAKIGFDAKMNFEYQTAKAGTDYPAMLKSSGAVAAVFVIDDPNQPIALIAPEDNWAFVNVAKVGRNLRSKSAMAKFLPSRTAKEISRVTAMLCGASRSDFKGNVMEVDKIEDLDLIEDGLPMDRVMAMMKHLKALGMTMEKRTTYRRACQEGWAPAPTNEIQKAIWDKVHELPKNPIKILPEPKPVKE